MLTNYFTPDYLFGLAMPGAPFHLSDKLYFQFGILLVVVAFALMFFRRSVRNPLKKHLLGRWQHLTLTIGLLALLWTAFRYETIQFFSMRILVWLVYLSGLIWAIFILKYWRIEHRHKLKEHEKEELKKRYM